MLEAEASFVGEPSRQAVQVTCISVRLDQVEIHLGWLDYAAACGGQQSSEQ
jgi:hypothetical protein